MENTLLNQTINQLYPVVGTILLGLLSWGSAEFINFIRKKTRNDRLTALLTIISNESITAVSEIEQTLRKSLANGKLSDEEKKQLKRIAMEKVKSRIIPATMKVARKNLNDVDDYISAKIEEAVVNLKRKNSGV